MNFIISIVVVGLLLSADCRRRRVKLNWKRVAVWHRDRVLPVRRLDKIVRLKNLPPNLFSLWVSSTVVAI